MLNLLAFVSGLLAVPHFPALPSFHPLLLLAALPLAIIPRIRPLVMLALGLCWGLMAGRMLLANQLPQPLEGLDLDVSGEVVGLPQTREAGQRFLFRIDQVAPPGEVDHQAGTLRLPLTTMLTWYGEQEVNVGERWRFAVRLKRPRALVNEGGFDYQRWLLSRGIGATGYIRQSPDPYLLGSSGFYPVLGFRARLRGWITSAADEEVRGPLLALAIGDNSHISPQQWQQFRATGTGHLMAISGLHIGLVATFGFFIGRWLAAICCLLGWQGRVIRTLPNIGSSLLAVAYAALAGFALPTQRALVMVLILNIAWILGRNHLALRAVALAALVVLLIDPLAGMDLGFWLSFGAVVALIGFFQYRRRTGRKTLPAADKLVSFATAQGIVFIGLLLPLLVFNTPLSLLAPVANFVVIPVISFLVVIPLLISIALNAIGLELADLGLELASQTLLWALVFLDWLQSIGGPVHWSPADGRASPVAMILASVGLAVLILGRGLPGRWLATLLLMPVLFPLPTSSPPLRVTVLDVGQGLAVVVRTPNHTLLYDAGARFSDRFDTGEAVVLAYLRYHGIQTVDTLVVSHGDNDHAGGAHAVAAGVAVQQVLVGEALPDFPQATELCDEDRHWRWDAVDFRLVEPPFRVGSGDNNNLSCILVLSYGDQHLLLPGDIESPVERALIRHKQLPQPLQHLVAPHHGSLTSSTRDFVEYLQPKNVVVSAAYRSRYGHPHPRVTQRYLQRGAAIYNTAKAGQIDIRWAEGGAADISSLRERRSRYWY